MFFPVLFSTFLDGRKSYWVCRKKMIRKRIAITKYFIGPFLFQVNFSPLDSGDTVDREEILKALDDHNTDTSAELLNVREYRSDGKFLPI